MFELLVPPLRDRGEDIGLLIDFFLDHFRRQHGRPGLEFRPRPAAKLLGYQWPGNVRQLRNVIDSAVVLADGDQIEVGDLGLRGVASPASWNRWIWKLGTAADRRGPAPHRRKCAGCGPAAGHRPRDAVS